MLRVISLFIAFIAYLLASDTMISEKNKIVALKLLALLAIQTTGTPNSTNEYGKQVEKFDFIVGKILLFNKIMASYLRT